MNPESPACHQGSRPRNPAWCIHLTLGLLLVARACLVGAVDGADELHKARELSTQGDLRGALTLLEDMDSLSEPASDLQIDARLLRIDLLRRVGKPAQANKALSELHERLAAGADAQTAFLAQVHRQHALLHFQNGEFEAARGEMGAALALADQLGPDLRASLLNDAAILQQQAGDPAAAITQFTAAAELVMGKDAETSYRINAARAMLEDGRLQASLKEARRIAQRMDDSPHVSTVRHRLALAALLRQAVNRYGADAGYRLAALELLQGTGSDTTADDRHQSLVKGAMAELYADDRQFDAALHFARTALRSAARVDAQDLEYRWEWVLARAFSEQGEPEPAMAAYARAIASLGSLRASLDSFDRNTLDDIIKPLYYEYADLLLRHSAGLERGAGKQRLLSDARATLEALKVAEVQDYFREQCVGDEEVLLDQLAANTAVLYPVLLDDRLELLLTTDAGIEQIAVPAGRSNLVRLVRDFRLNIEANTGTGDYLRQARQLYDLLIRPLEPQLTRLRVETLVFVPDGPLRTIPLAALHDGEAFLIERYAIATAPGVTLIEPRAFAGRSYTTLAGGISESVQGFPALPGVQRELSALAGMLDAEVLENRSFTRDRVQSELQSGNYSIVHFATHGQFRDTYDDSFLLTYDDRLLINDLGRSIQSRSSNREPLELLVLSACETAAGDDRAALGLAGIALKAGARSALATLWEVDDRSAVDIVQAFYDSLSAGGHSRARSLQRAQLQLIHGGSNPHPSQWAPFLLIGNWL